MSKLKIGILTNCDDNCGYELVLRVFENPTMAELCIPIVFGYKDDVLQERKDKDIQTNFLTIRNIDDAAEDKLNVMDCRAQQPSDAAQPEGEGSKFRNCLHAALQNMDRLDAIIMCLDSTQFPCPAGCPEVFITDRTRVVVTEVRGMDSLNAIRTIMERNFGCSEIRMAIVSTTGEDVHELTSEAAGKGVWVYGAYTPQEYVGNGTYRHFDGCMVANAQIAEDIIRETDSKWTVRTIIGKDDNIIVSPIYFPGNSIDEEVDILRHTIYMAMDMHKCRTAYDGARACPLKKLFHDKRDDKRSNIE